MISLPSIHLHAVVAQELLAGAVDDRRPGWWSAVRLGLDSSVSTK